MIRENKVKREKEGEGGFTLVEVIIAISILTVGLLAVATMQTSAIRNNDNAFRVTEGLTLAQDSLEALMALPYDDPDLADGKTTTVTQDEYTITSTITIKSLVNAGPPPTVTETKEITVTVVRAGIGFSKIPRSLSGVKVEL